MADNFKTDLWTPRSVENTKKIYADWADTYDADVLGAGYETPARLAAMLARALPEKDADIHDFGCGTGLSGRALRAEGFTTIDGSDISPEMISHAKKTRVYRHLTLIDPESEPDIQAGAYAAITATGVISLGAAPPDLLGTLLGCLKPGGLLALSYNDATLKNAEYMQALNNATAATARLLDEDYGPHLLEKNMKSTVYILEKA